MKNVSYIIGNENIVNAPMKVYSDEALSFANDLSQAILKTPGIRRFPDAVAFAFWCRRGNIEKLKESFGDVSNRLGRGLVFHISPGNIPVNFAFTYMFGVLAGCANIVRLPSRNFPQTDLILDVIREVLEKHPEIEKRAAFIRYSADDEITSEYSKLADARMIWGGDRTVENIKKLGAKPRCVDITFADRYSICMIDAEAVLKADETVIKKLAEDFYNDTYLMDQNACSSPQMIFWVNDNAEARERFWNAVYDLAKDRYYLQDAVAVDKYTNLCQEAIENKEIIAGYKNKDNLLYRIEIKNTKEDITELRGKSGYFHEMAINDISDINDIITEKYQTLIYFGLDAEELRQNVIDNNLRGIDRIVPVGKSLDIGVIWDGYDLVRSLSRIVSLS